MHWALMNPYTDVAPSAEPAAFSTPPVSLWFCITFILAFGGISVAWCQFEVAQSYGEFCGIGQFPLVWGFGFLLYPAYVLCLISHAGVDDNFSMWVFYFYPILFLSTYYVTTIWLACRSKRNYAIWIFCVSYVVSVVLNYFNFIFVGMLHV